MDTCFYTIAVHKVGKNNNFGLVATSSYDVNFGNFACAQHINSRFSRRISDRLPQYTL